VEGFIGDDGVVADVDSRPVALLGADEDGSHRDLTVPEGAARKRLRALLMTNLALPV
jgi:hypothetical protein